MTEAEIKMWEQVRYLKESIPQREAKMLAITDEIAELRRKLDEMLKLNDKEKTRLGNLLADINKRWPDHE